MTPSERFAKAAGICLHEYDSKFQSARCKKCMVKRTDPTKRTIDFLDAREVLQVLEDLKLMDKFIQEKIYSAVLSRTSLYEFAKLCKDRTGKLANLASEWLERKK